MIQTITEEQNESKIEDAPIPPEEKKDPPSSGGLDRFFRR